MKRLVVLSVLGWFLRASVSAQTLFSIDFPEPLPIPHIPRGSAALSSDYFQVRLLVGYGPADSALILDRSLSPVFACTNIVTQYVPPPPGQPGLGHTYYWHEGASPLTDALLSVASVPSVANLPRLYPGW
jgi:hypothetical protein